MKVLIKEGVEVIAINVVCLGYTIGVVENIDKGKGTVIVNGYTYNVGDCLVLTETYRDKVSNH